VVSIQRILCPVDFSEFSAHAVEQALALARWYGASVTLLHVAWIELPPATFGAGPGPLSLSPDALARIEAEVRTFSEPWAAGHGSVHTSVRAGVAAPQILAEAAALPADLIVIGTHGRSGFERLMLGSTADKVLRKASCPVMTVPRRVDGESAPSVTFKRILCATDFSSGSKAALTYALSMAQEADARLTVVHVLEWPEVPAGDEPFARTLTAARDHWQAQQQSRLRAAVPAEARTWCQAEEVLAMGKPYQEILRVAAESAADLLVLGVQGRGALDLGLFGSTTSEVLRRAACPVLTVRG
jgi:nucleotide-binding universal stress UspA family protein